MRHIRFTVPGRPQAKARPRVVRGRAYTPSKTVKYERVVAGCALIALHGSGPLTGPVGLKLTVLMPRPSKIPKSHLLHGCKGRIYLAKGGNFPDLSNVIKAIEDGLNGVLFKDDSQVCHIEAHRFYAGSTEQTAVEVEAWTIDKEADDE